MQQNLSIIQNKYIPKYKIITEYDPKYCDLYIDYAKIYMNANGFWGFHNIDESVKETWMNMYPEFRRVVALVANITTHIINTRIEEILSKSLKIGDIKTITQVMLKVLDFQFRTEKEAGEIKDRAKTNKSAKNTGNASVSDIDIENIRSQVERMTTNA